MRTQPTQEQVKLYRHQIVAGTSKGPSEQKPIKILEKRERGTFTGSEKAYTNLGEKRAWAYPGTAQSF